MTLSDQAGVRHEPEPSAVTVLGPVARSALGFVLPHEHLTIDNAIHHLPAAGLDPQATVTMGMLGDLRVWPHAVISNLVMDDDAAALEDLEAYRGLGGLTLVEQTPRGMGRDLARLMDFAQQSGVNIIAGTGWYVLPGHGDQVAGRSVADLARQLVQDLTGPQPRAGVIGEIGISRQPEPDELRVLDAALIAQAQTGAPIWIHQTTTAPMRPLIDRLGRPGVDRSRIVLCHCDYDLRDVSLHREAMAMGLTVELDLFGFPAWNRRNWVHAPNDTLRTERLVELIGEGFGPRLLISQDLCQKLQLRRYGGYGYSHLQAHVRELFGTLGGSAEAWRMLTQDNPARLLAWSMAANEVGS